MHFLLPSISSSLPAVSLSGWLGDANVQLALLSIVPLIFVFCFGACIGSLMNVLVYRIPLGLPYVSPTSRCPSCETKLTMSGENIPILGWLLLRGKCRFCRSSISPEYPLVELGMALLWVLTYAVIYWNPSSVFFFLRPLQPEWGVNGFAETWPLFIVVVVLMSFLFGMTLVDAKTFTIPQQFTNAPMIVGIVGHVGWALWVQFGEGKSALDIRAPDTLWSIAAPGPYGWPLIGASIGATVGVGISWLLLERGVLKHSFSDSVAWEDAWLKETQEAFDAAVKQRDALIAEGKTDEANAIQMPQNPAEVDQQDLWRMYPHSRREILKEVLFLVPVLALGSVGYWIATKTTGPWIYNPGTLAHEPSVNAPLWLCVLSGCLLGYLIGAGVVWAMRIMGTVLFNKEALGMGDVHMMGAVGVCLGWIDPVLAFFGAAFLGMAGWVIGKVFFRNSKTTLPYGPYLALGTVLLFFAKPVFEHGLTLLMAAEPPLNLP
jgi:leader peptidase (prepilin peptidase)/N-methyltransferase